MTTTLRECLNEGPASPQQLQQATGLHQSTISRQLQNLGDAVVRLREGRNLTYALTANAFGSGNRLPLYRVGENGSHAAIANIRPLAHGGYYVERLDQMPDVLLGDSGTGYYEHLPYFLHDLAPQGFLGRQIAHELAERTGDFPEDPKYWNEEHIGRYLISNGDDLPGNFQFGDQARLRLRRRHAAIRREDYSDLADRIMNGELPGSSAGGEQPKFTGFSDDLATHIIVKFSPKGDHPVARRWRDILITEYHASETLRANGLPAAQYQLIEGHDRLFLETPRFDRSGEHGRSSMISLYYVDAEFTAEGSGWSRVMQALHHKQLVSSQDAQNAHVLEGFGRLINNTDMHLGNLSLSMAGDTFKLLPVYDMCSMGFAPKGGEVLPYRFTPQPPISLQAEADTRPLTDIARDCWSRITVDDRVSEEFRAFLIQGNPIDRIP